MSDLNKITEKQRRKLVQKAKLVLENEGIKKQKVANIILVSHNSKITITVVIYNRKCKSNLKKPSAKRAKETFQAETGIELKFLQL